jgi:hypothetical protein
MQAATNSAAQFAAQQQQQQQQASYVPMMGYAQQQQQLQQQCHDQAMATAAGFDSLSQQQLMMPSGSLNASLSGFCLMDTSISGLQQVCMQGGNMSHPSHVLNTAGTLNSAADGALDCCNSYNCLLMQGRGSTFSGSHAVLQQQQQQYDGLAAAAAAAGITPGGGGAAAAARTPWRQVSMSTDGTYGSAAAAAAAANAAAAVAAVSASGLARGGYGNAADTQQLQRQIMSAGCNVLSGGNNMSFTDPVSGSCLPNGPGNFRQQQQQPHVPLEEEQWMSGCGVGGYFDLQPSSRHNSGSFHAGLTPGMNPTAAQAGAASAQQHAAAVLSATAGGLPNLRAISESCMMSVDGYAALKTARQKQQLQQQQGLASRRTIPGSSAASFPQASLQQQQQQQQQQGMLAGRPPSSALSGSCLPSSPHNGDALAAAVAAASGSFAIGADAGGATEGLSAQLGAIDLASSGAVTTPVAAAAGGSGDGGGDCVSVAVASVAAVVQALALHLDSNTNLSGAEVQIQSDAGVLTVWLTGSGEQVQMANLNIVNLLPSQQLQQA